jgi:hypothetical protein
MQRKLKEILSIDANAKLAQKAIEVEDETSPIEKLPPEVMFEVTKYLDLFSLFSFSQTSRRHHDIATETLDQCNVLLKPINQIWHERIKRLIQLFTDYYEIWLDFGSASDMKFSYLKLRAYIEELHKNTIPDNIITRVIINYFSKESALLKKDDYHFKAYTDFQAHTDKILQKKMTLSLHIVLNYFITAAKEPAYRKEGDREVRELLYTYPEGNREGLWNDRFAYEYERQDNSESTYDYDPCSIS